MRLPQGNDSPTSELKRRQIRPMDKPCGKARNAFSDGSFGPIRRSASVVL